LAPAVLGECSVKDKVFSKLFNSILPQHLKHPRDSKLVIGTIGILLSAKKRGFLTRIRPELEKLIESGILIHPTLAGVLKKTA
jgi:hypothetical protein